MHLIRALLGCSGMSLLLVLLRHRPFRFSYRFFVGISDFHNSIAILLHLLVPHHDHSIAESSIIPLLLLSSFSLQLAFYNNMYLVQETKIRNVWARVASSLSFSFSFFASRGGLLEEALGDA